MPCTGDGRDAFRGAPQFPVNDFPIRGQKMKISVKRRGLGMFAAVFALVSGAAWALFYPAIQITAGPTPPVNVCTNASFNLPTLENTSTTNSLTGIMFVPGFGNVINANIPVA